VVDCGKILLNKHSGELGDEKWAILEQLFGASLDTGEAALAQNCLSQLRAMFPKSTRVERLIGIQHEALGDIDKAIEVYDRLLAKDPTDAISMKRKACAYRTMGKTKRAILMFVEYLQVFMTDYDAWTYLADLYLEEQMYNHALFCYEELILSNPQNFLYYIKAAEVKYTLGTQEDFVDSVKYYSYAIELSQTESTPGNLRALLGLTVVQKAISDSKSSTTDMATTAAWSKDKILELYKKDKVDDALCGIVQRSLDFF